MHYTQLQNAKISAHNSHEVVIIFLFNKARLESEGGQSVFQVDQDFFNHPKIHGEGWER